VNDISGNEILPGDLTGGLPKELPGEIRDFLVAMAFIHSGDKVTSQALTGGVASDIWRLDTSRQTLCVKRALSQLKVAQVWEVSTDRNAYEVLWFQTVAQMLPNVVPNVLAHDRTRGVFAMDFFAPEHYPV